MKKTLYTLSVNDYEPEITEITFPLMRNYAKKIGADFVIIDKRKFGEPWPCVYEKFQIYELSKQRGDDWSIFLDADTLIHPDMFDVTALLEKDTTFSNGSDFSPMRFKPDGYFKRDGRYIGKGNWCAVFSDWCRDYYHPLDDMTLDEAVANIQPTRAELGSGCVDPSHLIDDYVVSRNISRYGLKHVILSELEQRHRVSADSTAAAQALNRNVTTGLWLHWYSMDAKTKLLVMQRNLMAWIGAGMSQDPQVVANFANGWNGQAPWGEWLDALSLGDFKGDKLRMAIESLGVKF